MQRETKTGANIRNLMELFSVHKHSRSHNRIDQTAYLCTRPYILCVLSM